MELSDFSNVRTIHMVGIKGIAMAAFALWAIESGRTVTGSDVDEHFPSDDILKQKGISIYSGFAASHIHNNDMPDLVVYTGAHKGLDNVEVATAIELGIPVLPHGKALGIAMNGMSQISVAGSHGKTTTSAMIATVLMHAGMDPSYAIGSGVIKGLGNPGHHGSGDIFVAEADEYITDPQHDKTPRFLWQHPETLVVTNIDFDHPDAYEDLSAVQSAFLALQRNLVGKKVLILNSDNPASEVLKTAGGANKIISYGTGEGATYTIKNTVSGDGTTTFSLYTGSVELGSVCLHIPGNHNVENAAAAAVACLQYGVSWEKIAEGLSLFGGAKRRFDLLSSHNGILYYDDYAHHPKELASTLQAARSWFPKNRIIAVFQPHTYSRTKALFVEFSRAFYAADIVLLADIYASAREGFSTDISGKLVYEKLRGEHGSVYFTPGKSEIIEKLRSIKKEGDVIIFMGAGDIYSWEQDIIQGLTI